MTDETFIVSVPNQRLANALGDVEGVTVLVWDLQSDPPRAGIDLVVPSYLDGPAPLARLAGVRTQLVQSQSIGYDQVATYLPPGHVFANAASVHEASTAELALALILAAQRGLADFVRASTEGRWAPAWYPSLADRTVVLVGYGGVGAAIEARLAPFEVTMERVARRARTDERGAIHGIEELPRLLASADVVVVAVPLTASTTHLVNEAFLAAMPDDALLVNVARGRVADTEAILRHARTGRLRFALDVTDPEPLPTGHELLTLPNVLITPHVGGATNAMAPRMVALVRAQIERLRRGDEPINVVLRT